MIKPYEELTLADDFMFSKVMSNETICKEFVEILLNIKIDKIEYVDTQSSIDINPFSKGVRFDVYLKDSSRVFDIEIQTTNEGNLPERARYYQAMIDIDTLRKSADYNDLKESFVVFICKFDPFGKSLSKYSFETRCEELPDLNLNDKTHKIFYNIKAYEKSENPAVQAILKYLATQTPSSDFTERLSSAVQIAKGNEPWRANYMTFEMKLREREKKGRTEGLDEGLKQGLTQGRNEGAKDAKLETACNFIKMNFPLEQIALGTGLTLQEVESIKAKINSSVND